MTDQLQADASRQAVPSIRGYRYQVLRSVYEWLNLAEGDRLFLEGAEDFDRISGANAEVNQVKNIESGAAVTLRNAAVIAALNNYWFLVKKNPGHKIRFNFLTTASIGREVGNPFGAIRCGIEIWNAAGVNADLNQALECAAEIRTFLLSGSQLNEDLAAFLKSSTPEAVCRQLIQPVTWHTSGPTTGDVEGAIDRKLRSICWERHVPDHSVPMIRDRLEHIAWRTATNSDNRMLVIEDFYEAFGSATTVAIPQDQFAVLLRAFTAAGANGVTPEASHLKIVSTFARVGPPPPLLGKRVPRIALEKTIREGIDIHGIVTLHGGTGVGKTTHIAAMFAGTASTCLWVSCRDIESTQLQVALSEAGQLLDGDSRYQHIVLDDVEMISHERAIESTIPGFVYTLRRRRGGVVLTSYRPLAKRLVSYLGVDESCSIQVPPFDEHDVQELLGVHELHDKVAQKTWSAFIIAQTSGHPQLVVLRIAALARAGFPKPTHTDILTTPREIKDARTEARLLLAAGVPAAQKELLYRLSVVLGPFERERAVALATATSSIETPGEVFDCSVGPWIERISADGYRISPLLHGAGAEACGADWARETHAAIANVWSGFKTQTPWDVSATLVHATFGKNPAAIQRMALGLFRADEQVWKELAQTNPLYVRFYVGADQSFPGGPFANFCARFLQLQLAARSDPAATEDILDRVNHEYPVSHADLHIRLLRRLLLFVVTLPSLEPPLSRLIPIFGEMIETGASQLTDLQAVAATTSVELENLPRIDGDTFALGMGANLGQRIKTLENLSESIVLLDALAEPVRSRLLQLFREHRDMGRQLADNVWLFEKQSVSPRWRELADVLEKCWRCALRWGQEALAQSVASVHARTLHEDLGEGDSAIKIISDLLDIGDARYLLLDTHAKILSDIGQTAIALELWSESLSLWQQDPNLNVVGLAFAARNAGIAASREKQWTKASGLFELAASAALKASRHDMVAGLLADAAYASFHLPEKHEAVQLASRAIQELSQVPNSSKDIRSYYVHKAVGHLVLRMSELAKGEEVELDDVSPGACSIPKPQKKIAELPATPLEGTQANLVVFALATKVPLTSMTSLVANLRKSAYPVVRARVLDALMTEAISTGNVLSLVEYVAECSNALAAMRAQKAQGLEPWEISSVSNMPNSNEHELTAHGEYWVLYMCKGLFAFACRDGDLSATLSTWKESAERCEAPAMALQWIEFVQEASSKESRARLAGLRVQEWSERLSIAALIIHIDDVDPRMLFHAHFSLLQFANTRLGDEFVQPVCQALERGWRRAAGRRFSLISPSANVPKILLACDLTNASWQKVAKLFLATIPVVDVSLPEGAAEFARKLSQ